MESVHGWQVISVFGILFWILMSSFLNLTQKIRCITQPWVTRQVINETPFILRIQGAQHGFLDALFSTLSWVVSVPFYTACLPLLFWSGHGKLGRQLTLLMALCNYIGNVIKDLVSAPRPSCPPIRKVTATKDEKESALEYGFPSSHTLSTVCLSGCLLQYVLDYIDCGDDSLILIGVAIACLFVGLMGFGRIYLGMHSPIDVIGGLVIGLVILRIWLMVHHHVDQFILSGQNVTSYWVTLSLLLLFAYPTPEFPTPSFEYHAAFTGAALGIVIGVQQTYLQFHHENVPRLFTPQLSLGLYMRRMAVGVPIMLIVKLCIKNLSKWVLPVVCNTLGIPIRSSSYIPAITVKTADEKNDTKTQPGYLSMILLFPPDSFDVDTGIRFCQYAGLSWSAVSLVPCLFPHLWR
ncbi:lipid phosphate phosphatase delta-like [Papaver somniferum]|nr:lipid phosphate phosphatase delta-like [Papaver somniferum]